MEPRSQALQANSLPSEAPGKPLLHAKLVLSASNKTKGGWVPLITTGHLGGAARKIAGGHT